MNRQISTPKTTVIAQLPIIMKSAQNALPMPALRAGIFSPLKTAVIVASGLLLAAPASADLVVYEGFTGYTAGNLHNQAANSNTLGLNTSGTGAGLYSSTNTNATTSINYQATGLTFSNLTVSGGSVALNSSTGTVTGVALNNALSFTGTLYGSYLVNFSSTVVADNTPYAYVTIATTRTTGTTHFSSIADNSGAINSVAVGYDGLGANATNSGVILSGGSTYIVLASFTNVGVALSAETPGVATQWVLSTAQFDHFKSNGFAGLEAASIGATASDVTSVVSESMTSGTYSLFGDTNALRVGMNSNSGARTFTIDEIRFGTSLDAVTPIPEPATAAALVGLGALAVSALRRRRR